MTDVYAYQGEATPANVILDTNPRTASGVTVSASGYSAGVSDVLGIGRSVTQTIRYDGKLQFNDDEEILTIIAACMPLIAQRRAVRLRFSSSSRGMVVRR